jgi:hypothetical protein
MTDDELVAIAKAAGFRAEWLPMGRPKLLGFGMLSQGCYSYGIPVADFRRIVEAARAAPHESRLDTER